MKIKMTFRELRDKLRNLNQEQLNAPISCWNKYWRAPEESVSLCFDPQTGEPYFYILTDEELVEKAISK